MNEVIFNNKLLNDYMIITKIKESILPPLDTIRRKVPLKNGTDYIRKEVGEREIEIEFEITAESFEERENTINAITSKLYTLDEKELILRGRKRYKASLEGSTDLENIVHDGVGSLIFLATNPLSYSDIKTNILNDSITLYLSGTYKTKPKFIFNIDSNIDHIKITNTDTGKFVYVEHSFISGDVVEVDFNDKWKVRKNGVVIAEDIWTESDFFDLQVGENNISIEPLELDVTMEYQERWL